MAQTKRKRRTKHRGNAAGMVEARGRTGRRPTADEQKKSSSRGSGSGGRRQLREPTWKSAMLKAGTMAVLLFVMTQIGLIVKGTTVAAGGTVAVIAMLLYTPLAFWTDKWAYTRQQRRLAQQPGRR